jgi:hypothetical protein
MQDIPQDGLVGQWLPSSGGRSVSMSLRAKSLPGLIFLNRLPRRAARLTRPEWRPAYRRLAKLGASACRVTSPPVPWRPARA